MYIYVYNMNVCKYVHVYICLYVYVWYMQCNNYDRQVCILKGRHDHILC